SVADSLSHSPASRWPTRLAPTSLSSPAHMSRMPAPACSRTRAAAPAAPPVRTPRRPRSRSPARSSSTRASAARSRALARAPAAQPAPSCDLEVVYPCGPVFAAHLALAPPLRWRSCAQRKRVEELRDGPRLGGGLEAGRELDQGRLAVCGAHEADADGQSERRAHRHVDDRVAGDRRGRRARAKEVVAVDEVGRPGWGAGLGDERVEAAVDLVDRGDVRRIDEDRARTAHGVEGLLERGVELLAVA